MIKESIGNETDTVEGNAVQEVALARWTAALAYALLADAIVSVIWII